MHGRLVHEICVFSSYDHRYLRIVVLVRFGVEHWPRMDEFNKVLWCTVVSHVLVRACPRAENQPIRWHFWTSMWLYLNLFRPSLAH